MSSLRLASHLVPRHPIPLHALPTSASLAPSLAHIPSLPIAPTALHPHHPAIPSGILSPPTTTTNIPAMSERRVSSRIATAAATKAKAAPAPAAAAAAPAKKADAGAAKRKSDAKEKPAAKADKKAKPDSSSAAAASGAAATAASANGGSKADAPSASGGGGGASGGGGGGGGGGKLKVGDKLPELTLKTDAEDEVKVGEIKKAVIFAYPKANTPGCTTQAQCFRDAHTRFEQLGFRVFGLSNDNPTPLKNWKAKQNFQYTLLSDPKRDLIGKLTGSKSSTARSHFVIDADGKLAFTEVGVKPKESSDAAYEAASKL